jgi:hypothetical protein
MGQPTPALSRDRGALGKVRSLNWPGKALELQPLETGEQQYSAWGFDFDRHGRGP